MSLYTKFRSLMNTINKTCNVQVCSVPKKYQHLDFTPPQSAAKQAEIGLKWRAEHGRGGTLVGVARANQLKSKETLSPKTVKRMVSYFARHEVDKKAKGFNSGEEGFPSAGRIAWALWGGDAGRSWSQKLLKQMQTADNKLN